MLRTGWLALALLAVTAPIQAGHWNDFNRKLGLGWSDGYHAQNRQWVQEHHEPAVLAPRAQQATPPAPLPTSSRRTPVLPSQRSAHRPAYWNR